MDYEIFTIEETDLDWLTVAENLLNRDIKLGNKKDYTKSEYLMTATLLGLKWRPDFKELSETKELTVPCAVLCLRKCLLLNLETKRETKMEIGVRATTTKPRIQFKVNMKTRVIKIEIIPS